MAHWAKCLAEKTAILKTILCRGAVAGIIALGILGWALLLGRWLQRFGWGHKLNRMQPFRTVDWLYRAFVKS